MESLHGKKVVAFVGGTGMASITRAVHEAGAEQTLIVNCYDDGKSTGRQRRAVPGMLGASDVRKNVARFSEFEDLLERRVHTKEEALAVLEAHVLHMPLGMVSSARYWLSRIALKFDYTDCAFGNIVFGGMYLRTRQFNHVVDVFGHVCRSRVRVLNVSGDQNLWLKVTRADGSEWSEGDLCTTPGAAARSFRFFNDYGNVDFPVLASGIGKLVRDADVIIYGCGTQFSSLLPTYATRGLYSALRESKALRVYIANSTEDTDTYGASVGWLLEAMSDALSASAGSLVAKWNMPIDRVLVLRTGLRLGETLPVPVQYLPDGAGVFHNGPDVVDAIARLLSARA